MGHLRVEDKKRDRAFKQQKQTLSEKHKQHFLDLRHKAQKEQAAYRTYIDSIFELNSRSSTAPSDKSSVLKRFWSFVKSKKKNSCGVAPLRKNGTLVSDAKGKDDILNQQYSSVFSSDDPQTAPSSISFPSLTRARQSTTPVEKCTCYSHLQEG